MSTRATYKFHTANENTRPLPTVTDRRCAYIHHDGYPSGAHTYFMNWFEKSLDIQEETGQPLNVSFESFLAANPKAEVISDHCDHGDTEYRYDIYTADGRFSFDSHIVVWKYNFAIERWEGIFSATLEQFSKDLIADRVDTPSARAAYL